MRSSQTLGILEPDLHGSSFVIHVAGSRQGSWTRSFFARFVSTRFMHPTGVKSIYSGTSACDLLDASCHVPVTCVPMHVTCTATLSMMSAWFLYLSRNFHTPFNALWTEHKSKPERRFCEVSRVCFTPISRRLLFPVACSSPTCLRSTTLLDREYGAPPSQPFQNMQN